MAGGGMNAMLDAALELAGKGWAVFPCLWYGKDAKKPLTKNGHHDATTDFEVITKWWTMRPEAMIGAPVPPKLAVIDIDPRNGGNIDDLPPLPETLTVWSGRNDGGRHLYFRRPIGDLCATKLPAGIDLKVNGYCIMPPSIHPVGRNPYWWDPHPVVSMPEALKEIIRRKITARPKSGNGDRSGKGLLATIEKYPEKGVNNALYWAARRAVEDGIIDDLHEQMVDLAVKLGESRHQAEATVGSARRWAGV